MRQRLPYLALALAVALALGLALHATAAHAMTTTQQLDNPGIMTATYQNFVAQMNARINVALAPGSVWVKWSRGLLLGAFVISVIVSLARYVFGSTGIEGIVGTLVAGAITTALYTTYDNWTWAIFEAGNEAGILIQSILIGDNNIMGPSSYINNVLAAIKTQNQSWLTMSLWPLIEGFIMMIVEAVMSLAAFFACIWNSMVFGIVKLIGPMTFFSLFHERLSFIFDGWLRFLFGTALYGLVARVCMSVVVLVFEVAFNAPYPSSGAGGGGVLQTVVLGAADFNAFIYLCAICGTSILLLFAPAVFVVRIVGGAPIGIGGMIGRAGAAAGRALYLAGQVG